MTMTRTLILCKHATSVVFYLQKTVLRKSNFFNQAQTWLKWVKMLENALMNTNMFWVAVDDYSNELPGFLNQKPWKEYAVENLQPPWLEQ